LKRRQYGASSPKRLSIVAFRQIRSSAAAEGGGQLCDAAPGARQTPVRALSTPGDGLF
jgi:hypothetical protein